LKEPGATDPREDLIVQTEDLNITEEMVDLGQISQEGHRAIMNAIMGRGTTMIPVIVPMISKSSHADTAEMDGDPMTNV